jgi:hypothetical protein
MNLEKIFPCFKYSVYALLALNIFLFFEYAAPHEGIDSLGWVILLAMFEWQTRERRKPPGTLIGKTIFYGIHLLAYALILYAWAEYFRAKDWVDFLNETAWLVIVALIEIDVYLGDKNRWHKHWLHHSLKSLMYGGVFLLALKWGLDGDWLDFYDGVLWIVCFFAIEMNLVLRFAKRSRHAAA